METETKDCSKCASYRNIEDFLTNKQGNLNKTCSRYARKRPLPTSSTLDHWNDFVYKISSWRQEPEPDTLDVRFVFNLNELPISSESIIENICAGELSHIN